MIRKVCGCRYIPYILHKLSSGDLRVRYSAERKKGAALAVVIAEIFSERRFSSLQAAWR